MLFFKDGRYIFSCYEAGADPEGTP